MAAPVGNKNATKGKDWFNALRKECVQRKALEEIATVVVDAALAGEQWAIAEIGNRFDGKPGQSIDVVADLGVTVTWPLSKPKIEQ